MIGYERLELKGKKMTIETHCTNVIVILKIKFYSDFLKLLVLSRKMVFNFILLLNCPHYSLKIAFLVDHFVNWLLRLLCALKK